MWQEISPTIENALLFMLDKPETKDCHEFLVDAVIQFKSRGTDLVDLNIVVSPGTFKRYEGDFYEFKAILQYAFRRDHYVVAQFINFSTDWNKLEILSSRILPTATEWEDINERQHRLIKQTEDAADADSYRNIGNTARHLLQRLAEIVFDPAKHTPSDNSRPLGTSNSKNRLWAFILYKLSGGSGKTAVKEYALSILESSDKAIDLSNTTTHELNADVFLGQSCAISTITTVHLVKLAYDRPDPE